MNKVDPQGPWRLLSHLWTREDLGRYAKKWSQSPEMAIHRSDSPHWMAMTTGMAPFNKSPAIVKMPNDFPRCPKDIGRPNVFYFLFFLGPLLEKSCGKDNPSGDEPKR